MDNQYDRESDGLVFTIVEEPQLVAVVTDPLDQLRGLFLRNHWGLRIAGRGGMIFTRVDKDKWYFEPTTLDDPDLPKKAIERAKAILEEGIRVDGWIIGHEVKPQPVPEERGNDLDIGKVVLAVSVVSLAVLSAGLLAFLVPIMMTGRGISNVLLHDDHVLCCVLSDSDSTIVEIFRWFDD